MCVQYLEQCLRLDKFSITVNYFYLKQSTLWTYICGYLFEENFLIEPDVAHEPGQRYCQNHLS